MGIQGEASNDNIILDDIALDVAGTIRDLERLVGILERGRALGTEEGVVALETREKKRISQINSVGYVIHIRSHRQIRTDSSPRRPRDPQSPSP